MSNNREIQKTNQAGKTKLTAVTMGHGRSKRQFFVMLPHDAQGKAKLPHDTLNTVLRDLAVRHGDTYTVG